eukprot:gene1981-1373_t
MCMDTWYVNWESAGRATVKVAEDLHRQREQVAVKIIARRKQGGTEVAMECALLRLIKSPNVVRGCGADG